MIFDKGSFIKVNIKIDSEKQGRIFLRRKIQRNIPIHVTKITCFRCIVVNRTVRNRKLWNRKTTLKILICI